MPFRDCLWMPLTARTSVRHQSRQARNKRAAFIAAFEAARVTLKERVLRSGRLCGSAAMHVLWCSVAVAMAVSESTAFALANDR